MALYPQQCRIDCMSTTADDSSSPRERNVVDVQLDFSFPRGTLSVQAKLGEDRYTFRATNLIDWFSPLVFSVQDLVKGRPVTSSALGDEPGGVFIDIGRSGSEAYGVAFHLSHGAEELVGSKSWLPIRGQLLGAHAVDVHQFTVRFVQALAVVRARDVDHTGLIRDWGFRFPESEFHFLERQAYRSGYRPALNPLDRS